MTAAEAGSPRERKTETRKRLITEVVLDSGSATAQDLATRFGVSIVTIHRDLDELERRGVVRKFHGGVTAQPSGIFESQMSYRLATMTSEKTAIAETALEHVHPGMSILLDDSTTTLKMVEGLPDRAPLHVATTFVAGLRQLSELTHDHNLTVIGIGIGGRYDVAHDSFVGVQTNEQVRGIHVDAVFMSTSAVSATDMFHQEEQIVALKREMLNSATKKYLLVDHTKLGRLALLKIASLTELDLIITDAGADPAILAAWAGAGIDYAVAQ
ncbi:DeoR/GlpR family DNA-binding transcription regulator [Microlunatus capsulatus]|uniref:DeoR/GlpR family transcriptional regulator of sugar metabolism n=1 Tax=Microlunatus capsulatus TaxID=99117 RepID=A0ABS4Z6R5_9ACTN|nr:DeoR/GlpR family DNA-binding transcription regulator [Microlunatus capsulatus]MBP2416737.1 DeoR/GlpR family transcriptional regulator of sugar metabolism [Microlunatus capsulatus]